jgi:predicted O-methyltransferase YrrM
VRIEDIETYAKEHGVPIMEHEGIEFLTKYVRDHNVKNILEIGTAIGYSAIRMTMMDKDITVTTIERDKERYEEAIKNIKAFNLEDKINAIYGDALEVEVTGYYDLIFIDAAKAQSIKFFQKYEKNLNDNGTIITDNINFHGLTFSNDKIDSRNVRQLIRKIKTYLEWLDNNKEYDSKYVDIGDGLMISKRNNK